MITKTKEVSDTKVINKIFEIGFTYKAAVCILKLLKIRTEGREVELNDELLKEISRTFYEYNSIDSMTKRQGYLNIHLHVAGSNTFIVEQSNPRTYAE